MEAGFVVSEDVQDVLSDDVNPMRRNKALADFSVTLFEHYVRHKGQFLDNDSHLLEAQTRQVLSKIRNG